MRMLYRCANPDCYGCLYNYYATQITDEVAYGYLYNYYASNHPTKSIAASGWHLPTYVEGDTLIQYVASYYNSNTDNDAAIALKMPGTDYWTLDTGATNSAKFNGKGSGVRNINGTFSVESLPTSAFTIACDSGKFGNYVEVIDIKGLTNVAGSPLYLDYRYGISVRLVKDSTTLSDGEEGEYIGNDGRVYRTICIGTQEWLASNLAETKYSDGTTIPLVTDNTEWANLTDGGRCSYHNDYNYTILVYNIANEGWHVPTSAEFKTLRMYLDPDGSDSYNTAGGDMKEVGNKYWGIPNEGATNISKFNARGSGSRDGDSAIFESLRNGAFYRYNDNIYMAELRNHTSTFYSQNRTFGGNQAGSGVAIRLLKDSTTLSNGEKGTYIGNDGKIYETICIGTQEWLAADLQETKFRCGKDIPYYGETTGSHWIELITSGLSVYDDNFRYLCQEPKPVTVTIPTWNFTSGGYGVTTLSIPIQLTYYIPIGGAGFAFGCQWELKGNPYPYKTIIITGFDGDVDGDGNNFFTLRDGDTEITTFPYYVNVEGYELGAKTNINTYFNDPTGLSKYYDQRANLYYTIVDTKLVQGLVNYTSRVYANPPVTAIYGYLYNWYAVDDSRNITSSDDWIVPSIADINTLITAVGGDTIAGTKLKEDSDVYWYINTGTNDYGFNARGAGLRSESNGQFMLLTQFFNMWSTDLSNGYPQYARLRYNYDNSVIYDTDHKAGFSIRLVRSSTTLNEGETGLYIANNGYKHQTICIGGVEWLSENLCETKYRNGEGISNIIDNTAWSTLTTGAYCAYDNDLGNVK